jgi:nucleotide-binding universal stress UspA family protein
MLESHISDKVRAIEDFRRLRRWAALQEIIAGLTGQSTNLLSYDDIRQRFRVSNGSFRGLQEVPLAAIVGSVSRYNDFTRNFLPRGSTDEERWARVKTAILSPSGVPPIELYKIGDVYFVVDGNHRVSVARELGNTHIQAYVTEFQTKVPIKPTDLPEDLIIKAEYAGFLDQTHLDKLRPGANLQVTVPGRYWELETQIEAHRYLLSQDQGREISYQEAAASWYDHVYMPVVRLIREQGILRDFPNRTETDLYLWILRRQTELAQELGWQIDAESAALDLSQHHPSASSIAARVDEKLGESLAAEGDKAGAAPGWQPQPRLQTRPNDRLFGYILVAFSGKPPSWAALDQALIVAQHEQSHLFGLTVIPRASEATQTLREEFNRRCQEAGVEGELSFTTGNIAQTIVNRARWADLVVVHLAHPPGGRILSKLGSGFRILLHRSPRPILAVPGPAVAFKQALLAYDGSPKAREGLYIAAYLARFWSMSLVVLTVAEQKRGRDKVLKQAQAQLEKRGVTATYISGSGNAAEAILQTAAEHEANLIIMGSYGSRPIVEVVMGSAVDQVLGATRCPMLICR